MFAWFARAALPPWFFPALYASAAVAVLLSVGGAYVYGRGDGYALCKGEHAAAALDAAKEDAAAAAVWEGITRTHVEANAETETSNDAVSQDLNAAIAADSRGVQCISAGIMRRLDGLK